MSAAYAADAPRWRSRRSWVVFWLTLAVLVAAVLLVLSGWLVRLHNDRQGLPILPPTVQPGASVSGRVTLTDSGLLPIVITLEPRNGDGTRPDSLPTGVEVTVRRLDDGSQLYRGPLAARMGPLEVLSPGQSSHLEVTVTATDKSGRAAIPLPYSYYWNASPALPWWWWIPVVLAAALLTGYVYRGRARDSAA